MTSETGPYVRPTDAVFWRQEIGTEIQSNNLGVGIVGQIAAARVAQRSGAPRLYEVMYLGRIKIMAVGSSST